MPSVPRLGQTLPAQWAAMALTAAGPDAAGTVGSCGPCRGWARPCRHGGQLWPLLWLGQTLLARWAAVALIVAGEDIAGRTDSRALTAAGVAPSNPERRAECAGAAAAIALGSPRSHRILKPKAESRQTEVGEKVAGREFGQKFSEIGALAGCDRRAVPLKGGGTELQTQAGDGHSWECPTSKHTLCCLHLQVPEPGSQTDLFSL